MRTSMLVLLWKIAALSCYAQQAPQPVRVKDWGQRIMMFIPDYWQDAKADEIIKQIGPAEFEKFKEFSDVNKIPGQMVLFNGRSMKDPVALYEKMNGLKLYRIAVYRHAPDGDIPMAILKVPYSENAHWDPDAKWNVIYFVVANRAVEEVK